MPPGLPNRVLHCIRRHEFIRPGDRVGVAVSGGADSVALLRLLLELRSRLGVVVLALHINHGLRGAESALDQALVTGLAAQLGVEAQVRTVDCRGCARQYGLSLEAAGRRLRYAAFAEIASECRLDCVATGHTLDDQAETVLLKLLRGAWTRGLAGIYPSVQKSGFRIVRPLLGIRRAELRQYLEALGQGWREDSTNADPAYLRNRVRGELMPLLQRDSNPAIVELLAGLAEIARGEQEFWDGRAAALWNACADVIAAGDAGSRERRFRFDRGRFATLSLAEQRRAIEHGLRQFMPLDSRHVDRARNALLNGENVSLPGGWDLCWLRGRVDLKRRLAGKAKGMSQKAQTHG